MLLDRLDQVLQARRDVDASRRQFLTAGAALGGGLLIGFGFEPSIPAAQGAAATTFAPSAFIRIDAAGKVTLTMSYVEMGQGTYTSIPMLIAEELEVRLEDVRLEHAPPSDKLYGNPALGGLQITGNSTAIRASWEPMRRAGAAARIMLVQAAAQRWGVDPTTCRAETGEVTHSPTGRRVKYGALVADAAKLSPPDPATLRLKPADDFKLIGTPARRLDTAGKVNGSAVYGIDAQVPGMKVAAVAASPTFGGRVRSVDPGTAMAVRGVRQVVQTDDAVAVVADHMGAARKGLAALDVQWDDGPNGQLDLATIVRDMELASDGMAVTARADGDFAQALAGAATKVEAVYQVPFLAHAALEPMNCTVHVRNDSCEVWTGTQVLARAQAAAARTAGLPLEKVTVHNHLLGGGFGRRLEIDGVIRAVQIARHVDGPVKVIYTREEDIQHDMYRPYFYDRLAAGLDTRGMPVAWRHRITGSSILARFLPPAFRNGVDPDTIDGAVDPPYRLKNVLVEYVRHEPPGVPTAFWRGVGPTHNVFMVESFIDELAATAQKDPVAYRLSLVDHNPRAKRVLQLAADEAGWGRSLPTGTGRGVSLQSAFGTFMAQVADVRVGGDGTVSVQRVVCAVDCGTVVNPDTIRAQVESGIIYGISGALFGEITLKNGRVEQSNFHDYRVLRMNEAPAVETHIVASREAPGGMGETPTSAVAPAVTNAIFAATGTRLRKLPVAEQLKRA